MIAQTKQATVHTRQTPTSTICLERDKRPKPKSSIANSNTKLFFQNGTNDEPVSMFH